MSDRQLARLGVAATFAVPGPLPTTMAPRHVSLWLLRGAVSGTRRNTVTISGRPVVRKELA